MAVYFAHTLLCSPPFLDYLPTQPQMNQPRHILAQEQLTLNTSVPTSFNPATYPTYRRLLLIVQMLAYSAYGECFNITSDLPDDAQVLILYMVVGRPSNLAATLRTPLKYAVRQSISQSLFSSLRQVATS